MGLSTAKTRRADMARVYAVLAALILALAGAGVIETGTAQHWTEVLASLVAMVGPWVAAYRTDPATPTGEPQVEYIARHRHDKN
jgi:hypothetical protein